MSKFKINTLKKIKVYDVVEIVFLTILGLYLAFLAEKTTTYHFEYATDVENFLLNAIKIVTYIKLVVFLWKKRQDILHDRVFLRKLIVFLACAISLWVIYYQVYRADKYKFLLFLGVLVVGTIGTDYRKIMKTQVVAVGLVIGATILASLTGFIDNYTYMRNGHMQSSWGLVASTDYASIIVYLTLTAWMAWKGVSSKPFIIMGIISIINSLFVARSTTSTIAGMLFLLAVIYDSVSIKKGRKLIAVISGVAFPFLAFITLSFEYLYHRGTSIGIKIDSFFHRRFSLMDSGFKNYKLSLFGTPFDQIGRGGSTFSNTDYNFIDSTYILILLRYGIALFAVITVLWVLMTRKAAKRGDYRLVLGMGIIAVHSFSEHHFPEVNYNILIILPFAVLGMDWLVSEKYTTKRTSEDKRSFNIGLLTFGIMVITLLSVGPRFLSFFRTIFDVTVNVEIKEKEKLIFAVFCIVIILLITVSVAVYKTLTLLIVGLINKEKGSRSVSVKKQIFAPVAIIVITIFVIIAGIVKGNRIIEGRGKAYQAVVDEEKTAITAVKTGIKKSGGNFYADELPELYRRTYGGVTESIFKGDELASRETTTVLIDANYEADPLMKMGFLYTEISEKHALYSNDVDVIRELESVGYHMTGYFSRILTVDLMEEAEMNSLEMTTTGAIKVEGKAHSLIYGPYYDLRAGDYTVVYNLSLPYIDNYDKDYKICTLRVGLRWGSEYVAEIPVFRRDFDENGRLKSEIKININDSRACEFKVVAEDGRVVLLNGISCQKTPDMDTHRSYDKKGRIIRESYFDLEGNPIEIDDGYHTVEYEYDGNNNKSFFRYYDNGDQPVITKKGYAGISKKYDLKKRVIRDTYYDQYGKRLSLESGYSAVGYGYDDNGNKNEFKYYDSEDIPVMIAKGYSIVRRTYDEQKNVTHEEYYDTDDKLATIPGGYAAVSYDYDDARRETLRCYYGEDGKLTVTNDGYAQRWRVLDSEGRVLREEYFGSDKKRIVIRKGYAIAEYDYDMYGNQSRIAYYDANEIPVMNSAGYAILKKDYDKYKHVIKEEYYGDGGDRLTLGGGYSIARYAYDSDGNMTDMMYYGRDGKPVMYNGTYFHLHREFNDKHQIIRETYFDMDDKPITREEGYVIVEREYDDAGNANVYRYLDADGKPVMRTDGYAEAFYTFNDKKQKIRVEYRDVAGKPVIIPAGHSVAVYAYDENGNQTDVSFYDTDGNPATWWRDIFRIHSEYDEYKQVIREEYYDKSGDLMMRSDGFAVIEKSYDTSGNMIEQRYLDSDDNLVINTNGYAILCRDFNSEKRIIKEYYLGLERELVDSASGFAVIENTYNADGILVKTVHYNTKGEAVD